MVGSAFLRQSDFQSRNSRDLGSRLPGTRPNLGVALEQATILGLSSPRPKRLLAPSLVDFRGKAGIRALYQAIGIPTRDHISKAFGEIWGEDLGRSKRRPNDNGSNTHYLSSDKMFPSSVVVPVSENMGSRLPSLLSFASADEGTS